MKVNVNRVIDGAVLSALFLTVFVCGIFGVQWILTGYIGEINGEEFLGSVSAPQTEPVQNKEVAQPQPAMQAWADLISAQSAISVESDLAGNNKIIIEKESRKKLPIASLTKLMTAVIVLDNYNLSDTAVISQAADIRVPIEHDVKLGDVMTVENFLYLMLVGSSNRSAFALSELVGTQKFVEQMNEKAKSWGLEDTFFVEPTGLDSANISTAYDLAKLTIYILRDYPKIAEVSRVKELYIPGFGNVVNTDELLGEIPNIICSKTGFTKYANGCLLLATDNPNSNKYLVNIILGADDRFSEMQKLINFSNKICQ